LTEYCGAPGQGNYTIVRPRSLPRQCTQFTARADDTRSAGAPVGIEPLNKRESDEDAAFTEMNQRRNAVNVSQMGGIAQEPDGAIEQMCSLLDQAADLYLTFYDTETVRSENPSRFERDLESLGVISGSSLFWDRINPICGTYLYESAHELKGLATLLRSGNIAGSLELLSRAVVERCGRVSWLLDHNPAVTASDRAARAALELASSWQHVRQTVSSRLPGSHSKVKEATLRFKEARTCIEDTFSVVDRNDSPEIRDWILDGNAYPDYTALATWAWFGAEDEPQAAKYTYRMLCAFSHPSYAASLEHKFASNNSTMYRYDHKYINVVIRNSVAAYDRAFQAFTSYFDRNFVIVVAHQEQVAALWPIFEGDDSQSDNRGEQRE
jgi:hypothetical protein